jgi:hypothetical protein
MSKEEELEKVERQVHEGLGQIARQLEIIQRLKSQGYPTAGAERLLAYFERAQRSHEAHLARLQNSDWVPRRR